MNNHILLYKHLNMISQISLFFWLLLFFIIDYSTIYICGMFSQWFLILHSWEDCSSIRFHAATISLFLPNDRYSFCQWYRNLSRNWMCWQVNHNTLISSYNVVSLLFNAYIAKTYMIIQTMIVTIMMYYWFFVNHSEFLKHKL